MDQFPDINAKALALVILLAFIAQQLIKRLYMPIVEYLLGKDREQFPGVAAAADVMLFLAPYIEAVIAGVFCALAKVNLFSSWADPVFGIILTAVCASFAQDLIKKASDWPQALAQELYINKVMAQPAILAQIERIMERDA